MLTVATWRLGRKRRLVWTLEWLTLLPLTGPLPQTAHCCDKAISYLSRIRVTFEISGDSNRRSMGTRLILAALDGHPHQEF